MSISKSLSVSASGLTAERLRMDVISNNIANVNTTVTPEGTPYRRQSVIFGEVPEGSFPSMLRGAQGAKETGGGVRVLGIEKDRGPFKQVPDANSPTGYSYLPNIEPVIEMVDLITATRAYDAGVTAIGAAKQMQQKALEIGKG
jgi:flagellar basal-body rod protein FlgC